MEYKVLLIDDQHLDSSLQALKRLAKLDDISIDSVAFHKEGMDLIKQDSLFKYQAVILDATGFKEEGDQFKEVSNTGLRYSLKELGEMAETHLIPWFIYTGAPRNIENHEFEEEIKLSQEKVKFGRASRIYYTKTLHEQELLDDIKEAIDSSKEIQLLYKYHDVCEAIEELGFDKDARDKVVTMFYVLESDKIEIELQDMFNPIRKIIEKLFKTLGDFSIVDPLLVKGRMQLNPTSLLLSNRNNNYHKTTIPIAPIIQETLKNLLFITQDSSHSDGDLYLKVNDYYNSNRGRFLYKGCVMHLFEILVYFKEYLRDNKDVTVNESRWKKVEDTSKYLVQSGTIESLDSSGWYQFRLENENEIKKIHPAIGAKFNLEVGKSYTITFNYLTKFQYEIKKVE